MIKIILPVSLLLAIGPAEGSSGGMKTITFIGASVGKAWNLPEWHKRTGNTAYVFEMLDEYVFDKTSRLEDALARPARRFSFSKRFLRSLFSPVPPKPDIVIIKECAAYFPGDTGKHRALVSKWAESCRRKKIRLVLATVVPVTREHSARRPGRLDGILEFNDWLRKYCKEQGIPCLDLENSLRTSAKDRSLRNDYAGGDGLHLNSKAYETLDGILAGHLAGLAG